MINDTSFAFYNLLSLRKAVKKLKFNWLFAFRFLSKR